MQSETNRDALRAFASRLADILRPLDSAEEIKAGTTAVLGEHLSANRVAYFEVVGSDYVVDGDYTRGMPSSAGRYPMASFGPALLDAHLNGRTVADSDVMGNRALSDSERAA